MKILVDADACPVISQIEAVAKGYGIEVILLCDTAHIFNSEYCSVKTVGQGADAVDFALVNMCQKGDVAVTQDYGVAAMVLGKGGYCIHQSGKVFSDDNIGGLLMDRHLAKKARLSGKAHNSKCRKRTKADDRNFKEEFEKLILHIINE